MCHRISAKAGPRGIGAELGVYDDVFLCLSPGEPWLEHGIVGHRYKELCPTAYREMIDRWGHVIQGPRRYSVTAFLTRPSRASWRATACWQRSSVPPLACRLGVNTPTRTTA